MLRCWPAEYGRGGLVADAPVAPFLAPDVEIELAMAARHVAQGRVIVAQQRERIARLKAHGSCTRDHELTLDVFLSTLQIMEEHECALRASAEKFAAARRRVAH